MTKHHAENERMKHRFLVFSKEANGLSEPSLDAVAKALARFDEYNKHKPFKQFHFQQAVGFKNHLAAQNNLRSGERLSKATQNASEVRTKFAKTFTTTFFPVGDDTRAILDDWVTYLREVKLWGNDDPLFPATDIGRKPESLLFAATGLKRECWRNASAIRAIFREAFTAAGLLYFNPHSFRDTLVQLGKTRSPDIETFMAWSQNLGHENIDTTLNNYGNVTPERQREILQGLAKPQVQASSLVDDIAEAVVWKMREVGKR